MNKKISPHRSDYRWWVNIDTRWSDNDIYGHVNNVVYYSYIDSVVNRYLIEKGGLEPLVSSEIGIVVESFCRYRDSFCYPDPIECGLRVLELGNSSVRYEVGLFKNQLEQPHVWGGFVHVFVDRNSRRPVPIKQPIRSVLMALS